MNAGMSRIPLSPSLREFLRDESRASSVIVWGLALIGAASFSAAVLAIAFMN
jgi:hypothetical protein